jgi:hypothetical protein
MGVDMNGINVTRIHFVKTHILIQQTACNAFQKIIAEHKPKGRDVSAAEKCLNEHALEVAKYRRELRHLEAQCL